MPDTILNYNPLGMQPLPPQQHINPMPFSIMSQPLRAPYQPMQQQPPGVLGFLGPMAPIARQLINMFGESRGIYIPQARRDPFEIMTQPALSAMRGMSQAQANAATTEHLTKRLSDVFSAIGIPEEYASKASRIGMSLSGIPIIGQMMQGVMRQAMPQGLPSDMIPSVEMAIRTQYPMAAQMFAPRGELAKRQIAMSRGIYSVFGDTPEEQTQEMRRLNLTFRDLGDLTQQMAARGMLPRNVDSMKSAIKNMAETVSAMKEIFGPNAPVAQLMNELNNLTGGRIHRVNPQITQQLVSNIRTQSVLTGVPAGVTARLYQEGARMGMQYGVGSMGGVAATQIGMDLARMYTAGTTPGQFGAVNFEEALNRGQRIGMQIAGSRGGRATAILEMMLDRGYIDDDMKQHPIVQRYLRGDTPYVTRDMLTRAEGDFAPLLTAAQVREYEQDPELISQYMNRPRFQERMTRTAHATLRANDLKRVARMTHGLIAAEDIQASFAGLPADMADPAAMDFIRREGTNYYHRGLRNVLNEENFTNKDIAAIMEVGGSATGKDIDAVKKMLLYRDITSGRTRSLIMESRDFTELQRNLKIDLDELTAQHERRKSRFGEDVAPLPELEMTKSIIDDLKKYRGADASRAVVLNEYMKRGNQKASAHDIITMVGDRLAKENPELAPYIRGGIPVTETTLSELAPAQRKEYEKLRALMRIKEGGNIGDMLDFMITEGGAEYNAVIDELGVRKIATLAAKDAYQAPGDILSLPELVQRRRDAFAKSLAVRTIRRQMGHSLDYNLAESMSDTANVQGLRELLERLPEESLKQLKNNQITREQYEANMRAAKIGQQALRNSRMAADRLQDSAFMTDEDLERSNRRKQIISTISEATGKGEGDRLMQILTTDTPITKMFGAVKISGFAIDEVRRKMQQAEIGNKEALKWIEKNAPNIFDTSKWKAEDFGLKGGTEEQMLRQALGSFSAEAVSGETPQERFNRTTRQFFFLEATGKAKGFEIDQFRKFTEQYQAAKTDEGREKVFTDFQSFSKKRLALREHGFKNVITRAQELSKGIHSQGELITKLVNELGLTGREAEMVAGKLYQEGMEKLDDRGATFQDIIEAGAGEIDAYFIRRQNRMLREEGRIGGEEPGLGGTAFREIIDMFKSMFKELLSQVSIDITGTRFGLGDAKIKLNVDGGK